jgi:WD40 repeat protein
MESSMNLILHPVRPEAVTLNMGRLVRWSLGKVPYAILSTDTNFQETYATDHLEMVPNGDLFSINLPLQVDAILDEENWDPVGIIELRRWTDLEVVDQIIIPDTEFGLTSFNFSPNGRWLVAADYRIVLIDWRTRQWISQQTGSEWTRAAVFDPTSNYLGVTSTGQGGGSCSIYKVTEDKLVPLHLNLDRSGIQWSDWPDLADASATMCFSPDGKLLAIYLDAGSRPDTSHQEGEVVLYNVKTGQRQWMTPIYGNPGNRYSFNSDLAFTPDGRHLICANSINEILVFDVFNGDLRQRINMHISNPISSLALDAQSTTLWITTHDALIPISLSTSIS